MIASIFFYLTPRASSQKVYVSSYFFYYPFIYFLFSHRYSKINCKILSKQHVFSLSLNYQTLQSLAFMDFVCNFGLNEYRQKNIQSDIYAIPDQSSIPATSRSQCLFISLTFVSVYSCHGNF